MSHWLQMFSTSNRLLFTDSDYNHKFNPYVNVNFCMFIITYDDCTFAESSSRPDVWLTTFIDKPTLLFWKINSMRFFFYNVGKIKQIKQIEVSVLINEQVFSAESS